MSAAPVDATPSQLASTSPVDATPSQLASTSPSEPSTTTPQGPSVGEGSDKPINAAHNEAVIQSAAEGRRLYIGNLAYATTEAELKEFFKDYLIETVSIPTNPRTTRPVGYAFVDVSTATEGERAIAELNNQTILERKVSVQLARKPEETQVNADGEVKRRGSRTGRGRGRGRGGRGPRSGRTDEAAPANGEPNKVLPLTETTNEPAASTEKTDEPKAARPRQPPRQRGPPEDGVPSKTKIMVANLPYDMAEDKLTEMFKDFSPTSVKIALRPIPKFMIKKLQARNEPRKGRGFAFVTFSSEEEQQKAIAALNGKDLDGRELAVKVAIDSPQKEEEALQAQAKAENAKENGQPATQESVSAEATT